MRIVNIKNGLYGEVEEQFTNLGRNGQSWYQIRVCFSNGESVLIEKPYKSQHEAYEALKEMFK